MFRIYLLGISLFTISFIYAQEYKLDQQWTFLGPDYKPLEDGRQGATGIGPVEFIIANQQNKGWFLAGALNGGLFYTENGGKQWMSAGSDYWDYTTCSWADYHPTNPKTWFAYSHISGDNGKPGRMGNLGGIYRTLDGGLSWDMIGDKSAFVNSEWTVVNGFKFHPNNPEQLVAYTTDGLFHTENCSADKVVWSRVGDVDGNVYDVEFIGDQIFYSRLKDGKWTLVQADQSDMSRGTTLSFIDEMTDPIDGLTLEPRSDSLLVLINYTRKTDALWQYAIKDKQSKMLVDRQKIVFGSGRTFAVSPHNPNEVIIGNGLQMQKYDLSTLERDARLGTAYHVDLEFICYDPFDSKSIYIASHGGVYHTDDSGHKWLSRSNGLGVAEVEGIAVSEVDPDVIGIGCFHDGSSLRRNWEGQYEWKNINGGDGLIPLLPKDTTGTVYSSNQYTGGGLFISTDWGKRKTNIHSAVSRMTSGWQMTAVLHPENNDMLFFNYAYSNGSNIDVGRMLGEPKRENLERLTDFTKSHGLEKYSIFGIYNSEYHPNELYVHVIHMTKNDNGDPMNVHKVFKTDDCTAEAEAVISSWYELEIPRNDWIANITPDAKKSNKLYIAYVSGIWGTEMTDQDYGMIYQLKYSKKYVLKRETDISNNLPYSFTGRYNIALDGKGGMFFGTRTGIYYGSKKTLKGKDNWQKVGFNTPHCKVHGLYFHKKTNTLTVGYFGRGVWRYYL